MTTLLIVIISQIGKKQFGILLLLLFLELMLLEMVLMEGGCA